MSSVPPVASPAGDQVFEVQDAESSTSSPTTGCARNRSARSGGGRRRLRVDGHHVGARYHDLTHERAPGPGRIEPCRGPFLEAWPADLIDDFAQVGDQPRRAPALLRVRGGRNALSAAVRDVAEARGSASPVPTNAIRCASPTGRAGRRRNADHCDDRPGACPPGTMVPVTAYRPARRCRKAQRQQGAPTVIDDAPCLLDEVRRQRGQS